MAPEPNPGDTHWSPFVVVAAVDFSPASGYAVREALRLAGAQEEAEVHVVHVLEKAAKGMAPATRIEHLNTTLEEVPDEVRAFVAEQGHLSPLTVSSMPVGIHVRIGAPVHEVLQLTADVAADILVVGTHGKSTLERLFLGSVSEKIVRRAHCPVLIARPIDYSAVAHEEAAGTSSILPPCPDCMERRRATDGAEWWCERHSKPRETHYYSSKQVVQWTEHDSEVTATGVDM